MPMIELKSFTVGGTEINQQGTIVLDEIFIQGTPETIRQIGIFLINSAHEMEINDRDHLHLQDAAKEFCQTKHCDIILINENLIKKG